MEDAADNYLNDIGDFEIGYGPPAGGLEAYTQLVREFKRRALLQAYRDHMEVLMPRMEEFEEDAARTGEDPLVLQRRWVQGLIPHMTHIAEQIAMDDVSEAQLVVFARQELGEDLSEGEIMDILVSLALRPSLSLTCFPAHGVACRERMLSVTRTLIAR